MGTHIPDDELPAHERKVRIPATMLPELGALEILDFEAWLTQRRTSPGDMLRVQTVERYGVPSDDADFAAISGARRRQRLRTASRSFRNSVTA
ncbi:MAG: hypothetical protein ACRDRG_15705 [Pseudonocardiaceae bacterium]